MAKKGVCCLLGHTELLIAFGFDKCPEALLQRSCFLLLRHLSHSELDISFAPPSAETVLSMGWTVGQSCLGSLSRTSSSLSPAWDTQECALSRMHCGYVPRITCSVTRCRSVLMASVHSMACRLLENKMCFHSLRHLICCIAYSPS